MPDWGTLFRGILGGEEVFDPTSSSCVGSDSAVGVDKLSMHRARAATGLTEMVRDGIFEEAVLGERASIERCCQGRTVRYGRDRLITRANTCVT